MRTILHTSLVLLTLATSSAYATTANRSEAHLSKADLKSQAMELCRAETEQRYGVNTIKLLNINLPNDLSEIISRMIYGK